MTYDLKYTDRDVREDPHLKQLAITYLEGYGGEFDPLIRAQNMIAMDGDLTTVMARTVLNCMRLDTAVSQSLPAPRGFTLPQSPRRRASEPVTPVREPRILTIGDGRYQDYEYRVRLRFDYVVNLHKQAKWYHKIDHSATRLSFIPADWPNPHRHYEPNSFSLRELRGMCGKDLSRAVGVTKFLGTLEDAEESDNEFCPRCRYGHRDAGWKP